MDQSTTTHVPGKAGRHAGPPMFLADLDAERVGWYQVKTLVRALTPREWLIPGYYLDPDWTVRDLVAHLGTWLAEAAVQFERIHVGTYEQYEVDIDAINAALLAGMVGQPWNVAWVQANAARTRMLDEWAHLADQTEQAAWWIRKAGGDHYGEHLERLRDWTADLIGRRR